MSWDAHVRCIFQGEREREADRCRYATAKHGIVAFMRSEAAHYADSGITINAGSSFPSPRLLLR